MPTRLDGAGSFATLECELIDRRRFATKAEARMTVFQFIEGWYNPRRRHSSLGSESPVTYEKNHYKALTVSYSETVRQSGFTPDRAGGWFNRQAPRV